MGKRGQRPTEDQERGRPRHRALWWSLSDSTSEVMCWSGVGARCQVRLTPDPNAWQSVREIQRRIEPNAKNGAGRQLHILTLGCGNDTARSYQDPGQCALEPAKDATDHRADAGTHSDSIRLALKSLTLESLRQGRVDRVSASIHDGGVERQRDSSLPI